jgi:hypothetical protein
MLTLTLLFIGAVAFLIAGFEGVAWATIILIGLFAFFGLSIWCVNSLVEQWDKAGEAERKAKFIRDNE